MPDSFLRYRFDRSEEIRRHLHVVDGRALLFYPHLDSALGIGSRVALEVELAGSGQVCTAHGTVAALSEAPRGVWLEFPNPGVASGIEEALRSPKRHHRRISTNLLVNVSRTPTVSHLARLIDLSPTSARLGELSAKVGDRLWLRVLGALPQMPGDLGPARVTWARADEAGVHLLGGSIGRAVVMNLVLRMDGLWDSSKSVSHAAVCRCTKDRSVREPSSPPSPHSLASNV